MNWIQEKIAEARLKGLKELDLSLYNTPDKNADRLTKFPQEILELTQLEELDLGDHRVGELPKEIARLQNLTHLLLGHNVGIRIPHELGQLRRLTKLDLSFTQVTDFPWLAELAALRELHLFSNGLRELPESLLRLKLRTLFLHGNSLDHLPRWFSKLSSLEQLALGSNRSAELLPEVLELENLSFLECQTNKILRIPPEIGRLRKLSYLNLDNNLITHIPRAVGELPKLTNFSMKNNPIEDPPPEIAGRGIEAIRGYFSALKQEPAARLFEAKLILVGEGEVGKTSLANRLSDPGFDLDRDQARLATTRGIEIKPWVIKSPVAERFKINLWDFGGQEIYHATHQFFLTKRSLYLFVWDARKEDRLAGFDYWLHAVGLLSGGSPILVVLNKSDERVKEIDQAGLQKQFPGIFGFHKVSARTGAGIEGLLREIHQAIVSLKHVGVEWPGAWSRVRTKLEKEPRDYIDHAEYLRICEQEGVDRDRADVLSDYLHDLGVILHFQEDPVLQKIVILKPEWGTSAVYQVLDTKSVQERLGRFSFKDLARIWSSARYPQDKHLELLQLMSKFELCFPLGKSQDYIAPELLPAERPAFPWDEQNVLQFQYHYTFMPAGIITRFIARMHDLIDGQKFWRNGVVLRWENTWALLLSEPLGRRIRIQVRGADPKGLLSIIRADLDHIHATLNHPALQEKVPCICSACAAGSPFFFDYRLLRRFFEAGIAETICNESLKQVRVYDLLAGVLERKMIEALERGGPREVMADRQVSHEPAQTSTFLHLSDLHFGTREQADLWYGQLAEDLHQDLGCTRLDGLILSGDIANKSEPEEYAAAEQFVRQLAGEFGLSPQQIVVVPGNHDLNWGLSEDAYQPHKRKSYKGPLTEGHYIEQKDYIEVRDDGHYQKRFGHFAKFYEAVTQQPYPPGYEAQATLHLFPAQKLVIVGLNSAWQLDHHFKSRAGIYPGAVARVLGSIRSNPALAGTRLKLAVWHHPVHSAGEDRIIDHGFLEQLAKAGFRIGLHGHIHRTDNGLFRYEQGAEGRKIDLIAAGTFGAPVREWVPGYPLQYNLLKLAGGTLTVETRRREELNGAWQPDARWGQGRGRDSLPRYHIDL